MYILTPSLLTPFPIKAGFARSNTEKMEKKENIIEFLSSKKKALGISHAHTFQIMDQVHSHRIINDVEYSAEDFPQADGMYTQKKGIVLITKMADCISALFYSPKTHLIAAVHAGWRSLAGNIFTRFLQRIKQENRGNPEDFFVTLSPSIGPCCNEFSRPYDETPSSFHTFVHKEKDRYVVDLWNISHAELLRAGMVRENISLPEFCTKCDPQERFWSYRRHDKGTARNIAFICLDNE